MKRSWNPEAQEQVIAFLIKSGANPDQFDKSHVAALHRAVRSRSTAAVLSMLKGGACVRIRNGNGSTPLHLAVQNTGSSGSGSPESKAQQQCIIEVLLKFGADPKDRDAQGKSVREWIKEEWIRKLFSDPFF